MQSKTGNTPFIYMLLFIAIGLMIYAYVTNQTPMATVSLQQLVEDINQGKVKEIVISGDTLRITYIDDKIVQANKESNSPLIEQLQWLGVDQTALRKVALMPKAPTNWNNWANIGGTLILTVVMGFLFLTFIRQIQGANNQAMAFGKSRARMFTSDRPTVTFADVAGVEEAKEELREVVEFLKEPQKFLNLGARIPKGVLLMGAPGTGKTLMAKAVAGEAGVPFFSISGSEFVEMFVGVGASRVRDLFDQAKRHSPCIVFIDEIDAVGRHRGAGLGGSHDEREQTLNQILVEMDGFDTDTNIIVIAATNRPDVLDPALLRPGRFDRRVVLDQPDMRGREAIFAVHTRGKPLASDVDLSVLAQATPGFVGADIENVVNEAAILAARRGKKRIGMTEFQEAIERVIAGPERRSRLITEEERRIVAYHEVGHAIVAHVLPLADKVRKISIVARGMAAGYTITLPEQDRYLTPRSKLLQEMAVMLGGRAAEATVFNDITTGAANDLERVTQIARSMVTRYGMSEELGPLVYGKKEELVFLGKEIGEQRDYSEAIAQRIDAEVQTIVRQAYEQALSVLNAHREAMERIVQALLERETLNAEEFSALFEGRPLLPTNAKPKAATQSVASAA